MKAGALFPGWGEVHEDLLRCLAFIPADGMTFRPTPSQMTVASLFRHVIAVEEYWQDVLESIRTEFREYPETELPGKAEIAARLRATHDRTRRILEAWETSRAMDSTFASAGVPLSAFQILSHCHDHLVHHRAQLLVYLRLMGLDPAARKHIAS